MGGCSILGCKTRSESKEDRISFHSFPTDPGIKEKWVDATGRPNWQPSKYARICSKHFDANSYVFKENFTRLKPYAIPNKDVHNMDIGDRSAQSALATEYFDSMPSTSSKAVKRMRQKSNDENVSPLTKTPKLVDNPIDKNKNADNTLQDVSNITPIPNASLTEKDIITPDDAVQATLKLLDKQKQISAKRLKKLHAVRESRRRLQNKVAKLENVLLELRSKMFINMEEAEVLRSIENGNKDFLKRFLVASNSRRQYSSELRKFALCLHFISPKAYLYVRKTFNTCLPHPKTIYNWYKVIDCTPGFTQESFEAIKTLVNKSNEKIVCALSMDEMAIRQQLTWDGKKTVGYVDVGDNLDTDVLLTAREALVFLVTAINGAWKLPVGYFFINGCTAENKSALVKTCVNLLTECGIVIASLTFDGCPANFAMAKILGATIDVEDLKNINPVINVAEHSIVIIPDPCHRLKLVRNTFGDKRNLLNGEDKNVSWEYITKLHQLQEEEGVHLANKLRKQHVEFKNQVMKVRLATQTFSKSVAQALFFCKEVNINGFENVDATAEFIQLFNDVFDILNSRKLFSYGFKKPISKNNYSLVKEKMDEFIKYVHGLKLNTGPVLKSARKTGFLGLVCCLRSLEILYEKLINVPNASLNYLCTYKLSQDHLEIFFGSIRARGGFNNNPSAQQFKTAYKRLLIHGEIQHLNKYGNCVSLDDINILNINKNYYVNKINVTSTQIDSSKSDQEADDNEILPVDVPVTHDYLLNNQLTEFTQEVTTYIAGFIVRRLKKQLKCDDCILALQSTEKISRLISLKDVGGLNYPSADTVNICVYSEKVLRFFLNSQGLSQFHDKKTMPKLVLNVFKYFANKKVFLTLQNHIHDQDPFDNHLTLLIKSIALRYLQIRINHVLKMISKNDLSIRKKYTKLILFKGQ